MIRNFFWLGIFGDVTRFSQSCDISQMMVNRGSVKVAPVRLMPLLGIPFEKAAIDLIGPLSPHTDKYHRWVLMLVDCTIRYPEAIPLSSKSTVVVAEAFLSISTRVGFHREILTDNGPQLASGVMKEVARLMYIYSKYLTEL